MSDLVALRARFRDHFSPSPDTSERRTALRQGFGRLGAIAVKGLGIVAVLMVVALGASAAWTLYQVPITDVDAEPVQSAIVIEAADGTPLGRKGAIVERATYEEFPESLKQAVIAIEDHRFRRHFGVDPLAVARATYRNLRAGRYAEGGSTITQQLVKLQWDDDARTLDRKLREAVIALWLEARLDKDAILTNYLNRVYMGVNTYGLAAAARVYFDKAVSDLTLAESAMLAGIIRAPTRLNPRIAWDAARDRAAVVLDAMVKTGAIDKATAELAKANPAKTRAPETEAAGSWFADWTAEQAAEIAGSFTGTMRIRTTLIPEIQDVAMRAVSETLAEQGGSSNASQAALVAIRPDGAIVAMVGGRDYQASQFNRAVQANRQPGSAFKLFVYLAALRNGYGLDDIVEDTPIDVGGWKPANYGDRYHGAVTLADAFAKSMNAATVRIAQQVGIDQVIAAARDLGIDAPLPEHPSLALGTAELSLLDLTAAYASVHADRAPLEPRGILGFAPQDRKQLFSTVPPPDQVERLGPDRDQLIQVLQDVVEHGTGRAASLDGFAAGKTGTSQDYRDGWFIGFNDRLTVGVWVGNDDSTSMNEVTGGSLPAAIWKRFQTEAGALLDRDAPATETGEATTVHVNRGADESTRFNVPPAIEQVMEDRYEGADPADAGDRYCDYRACSATYRSFRASDCTYQPYSGPRRYCDRAPGQSADALQPPETYAEPEMRPSAGQCNVPACSSRYNSFDPIDCSYQPYDSPGRRLCTL
jgi:penicillin-binding protein 1A